MVVILLRDMNLGWYLLGGFNYFVECSYLVRVLVVG